MPRGIVAARTRVRSRERSRGLQSVFCRGGPSHGYHQAGMRVEGRGTRQGSGHRGRGSAHRIGLEELHTRAHMRTFSKNAPQHHPSRRLQQASKPSRPSSTIPSKDHGRPSPVGHAAAGTPSCLSFSQHPPPHLTSASPASPASCRWLSTSSMVDSGLAVEPLGLSSPRAVASVPRPSRGWTPSASSHSTRGLGAAPNCIDFPPAVLCIRSRHKRNRPHRGNNQHATHLL